MQLEIDANSQLLPRYSALPIAGDVSLSPSGYILSKKIQDGSYVVLNIRNQYFHTIYTLNFMSGEPIILIDHNSFESMELKYQTKLYKKIIRLKLNKGSNEEMEVSIRLPNMFKSNCKIRFLNQDVTYYWTPRSISRWYLTAKGSENWLATYQDDKKCQTFGKIELLESISNYHHDLLASIMALVRFKSI
ncbi:hypothetical protein K502DRAFT_326087 [Neoconidiobolus thromboides FSU 785]|nr:hypothetical protein K502DRAFT_326087 [Neoconidiobolus thromboides FSU 785]